MTIDILMDEVSNRVERFINREMEQVYASRDIGLDPRCGSIYINEDCIAVDKCRQGTLEYYGGFEYVNKDYRYEMGGYVFYLALDSRVAEHIESFYMPDEDEDEAAA
jgi:hypothetical protein